MADQTPGVTKAVTSAVGGALATIVCWGVDTFGGVTVPAEVALALGTIFTTALVYFAPHQMGGP